MQDWIEGGEAGQYSPGASSTLTQIVPYSASLYAVFHSVIYNSVAYTNQGWEFNLLIFDLLIFNLSIFDLSIFSIFEKERPWLNCGSNSILFTIESIFRSFYHKKLLIRSKNRLSNSQPWYQPLRNNLFSYCSGLKAKTAIPYTSYSLSRRHHHVFCYTVVYANLKMSM